MKKSFNNSKNLSNYESLDVESYQTEIVSNKMNNAIGFDHTRWFRIENALDNSVVELVGNKLVTRPQDPARVAFQTFQSNLTESGHFTIRSQEQTDEATPHVWDYLSHSKLLIQKKPNRAARRTNQNWISKVTGVQGATSTYFIISAPELNKVLKNMGVDNQIKAVPQEEVIGDRSAHWRLVMLEPIAK